LITASATLTALLGSSMTYRCRVESWLGGELLAYDIPVSGGSEEVDRGLRVPERLTLTVPRTADGVSYAPVADDAPLAANGQRLRLLLGIDIGQGITEWLQRGWYLVQESVANGDTISVTGVGLLAMIDEARLVTPYQPTSTIGAAIRDLLEPALTVDLTNAPTDRTAPTSINFDNDRLSGVLELLDAWPAEGVVSADGVFVVTAPTTTFTPVKEITTDNVIVRDVGSSTRDGAFNAVVAQGSATDGAQVQGVAYLDVGPKSYGGLFNPLPVPYYFSSPLLTTVAQCTAAADTIAARLERVVAAQVDAEIIIDPTIQGGDVVTAAPSGLDPFTATVETLSLPVVASGPMRVGLRKVPT